MSITAGDCEVIPQSLVAKYGRTNLFNVAFNGEYGAIAEGDFGFNGTSQNVILVSTRVSDYLATSGSVLAYLGPGDVQAENVTALDAPATYPWTDAVVVETPVDVGRVVGSVTQGEIPVFATNYGVQVNPVIQNGGLAEGSYLQHDAPVNLFGTGVTYGGGGGTNLGAGTYTYAFTYYTGDQQATFTSSPRITYQETTPYYGLTPITLGAPGSITLTPAGGNLWAGTFPLDAQAQYSVNIYRSSTSQPTFFFVANIPSTGTLPNGTYTDNSSDATIAANAQLTLNRDVPPVKQYGDFTHVPATHNVINDPQTYYPGAPMWSHQGRLWFFAFVRNGDTNSSAQFQLWYSNLLRAWEFDKVNNVFLVDLPGSLGPTTNFVVPQLPGTFPPTSVSNPYVYPNNLYIEMPVAGISLASVGLFWTTKRFFTLYGNSPATYVFQCVGNVGCSSQNSLAYAATDSSVGAFWMSEQGVMFTNGQSYSYVSEDIRSVIDALPIYDRYNCAGFYSNHTYYISFPQSNQTWAYRTTTNQWHGPLPYSTVDAISIPSDQLLTGTGATSGFMNSVVAIRGNASTSVDEWFTQVDLDLGNPQTVTYQSRDQGTIAAPSIVQAGLPVHIEKEYTILAFVNKPVTGVAKGTLFATVTLTVDDDPTKFCTVQFDLTLGPIQIATMSYQGNGNVLRGYVASLTVTYSTATAVTNMPIQIKNVTVYGKAAQRNLTPTVGMS